MDSHFGFALGQLTGMQLSKAVVDEDSIPYRVRAFRRMMATQKTHVALDVGVEAQVRADPEGSPKVQETIERLFVRLFENDRKASRGGRIPSTLPRLECFGGP